MPPLIRFLLKWSLIGMAAGWVFVGLLLLADLGGIRSLLHRADSPLLWVFVLGFSFGILCLATLWAACALFAAEIDSARIQLSAVKPVRAAELLAAVRDVHAGGAPMTSNIARRVVQAFKKPPATPAAGGALAGLSEREAEVLDLLAQGYSYKEIATQAGVSYHTVHSHVRHIYEKLHVRSRAQAVAIYNRRR